MINIGIFSAVNDETEQLKNAFAIAQHKKCNISGFEFDTYETDKIHVLVANTGVGTSFASIVTTLITTATKPDYIFFIGTAGAVNPKIKVNDVVIARDAFEAELQVARTRVKDTPFKNSFYQKLKNAVAPTHYPADQTLQVMAETVAGTDPSIYFGTVATTNAFPAPSDCYDVIKKANSLAIDMETSAFYQTAWLLGVPALSVRGISNQLNADGTENNAAGTDTTRCIDSATQCLLRIVHALIPDSG